MPASSNASLELVAVSHSYQKQNLLVLDGINLQIEEGQMVCIVGESGSGKSTLLSIAGLLLQPSGGKVKLGGKLVSNKQIEAKFRAKNLGFVYQNQFLLEDLTAQENVELPLLMQGIEPKIAQANSCKFLTKLGLAERTKHLPSQLSEGERQRIAVARAAICSPKIIIADEPTGNLSRAQGLEVFTILKNLTRERPSSCLLVTHDMDLAAKADKVYQLIGGRLAECLQGKG